MWGKTVRHFQLKHYSEFHHADTCHKAVWYCMADLGPLRDIINDRHILSFCPDTPSRRKSSNRLLIHPRFAKRAIQDPAEGHAGTVGFDPSEIQYKRRDPQRHCNIMIEVEEQHEGSKDLIPSLHNITPTSNAADNQVVLDEHLEDQIRKVEYQSKKLEILLQAMRSGTAENAKLLLGRLRSNDTLDDIVLLYAHRQRTRSLKHLKPTPDT